MKIQQASPGGKTKSSRPKTKRVLVIDDDLTLEPILRTTLKSMCPNVVIDWLYTADEFMAKISQGTGPFNYELILTDINLPGARDGFDIWAHLAKNFANVPVVIMSGLSQEEYLQAAGRRLLSPWYLTKPITTAANTDVIRGLLNPE